MELSVSSLLETLTAEEQSALGTFLRPLSFPDRAVLFRQGALPDGCFLVQEGQVRLENRLPGGSAIPAELLGVGDLVGEAALISQAPRTQTAIAVGAVRALFIEGKSLSILRSLISPLRTRFLLQLSTALARRVSALVQLPLIPDQDGAAQTPERAPLGHGEQPGFRVDLSAFFPVLPFFRDFAPSEIEALLAVAKVWELPRGRWLFAAGEPSHTAYITLRGACESVWRGLLPGRRISLWGPGKLIDPTELMLGSERRADCRVRENATVLALPHDTFRRLLSEGHPVASKLLSATTIELLERLTRATRLLATRDMARHLGLTDIGSQL